jgi:hypothetical protein
MRHEAKAERRDSGGVTRIQGWRREELRSQFRAKDAKIAKPICGKVEILKCGDPEAEECEEAAN